jgi:hypothetical protein
MHFPDAALRAVAAQLLAAADAPAALTTLVAACGVSRHWRDVCRHVGGAAVLHFDSLERCTRGRIGRALAPREARFRQVRARARAPQTGSWGGSSVLCLPLRLALTQVFVLVRALTSSERAV